MHSWCSSSFCKTLHAIDDDHQRDYLRLMGPSRSGGLPVLWCLRDLATPLCVVKPGQCFVPCNTIVLCRTGVVCCSIQHQCVVLNRSSLLLHSTPVCSYISWLIECQPYLEVIHMEMSFTVTKQST